MATTSATAVTTTTAEFDDHVREVFDGMYAVAQDAFGPTHPSPIFGDEGVQEGSSIAHCFETVDGQMVPGAESSLTLGAFWQFDSLDVGAIEETVDATRGFLDSSPLVDRAAEVSASAERADSPPTFGVFAEGPAFFEAALVNVDSDDFGVTVFLNIVGACRWRSSPVTTQAEQITKSRTRRTSRRVSGIGMPEERWWCKWRFRLMRVALDA